MAVGGELSRHGEGAVAFWRAVVADADRPQWTSASGISDRRDGDRARRVIERLARVIGDEFAIDLVLPARGDHQQVGVSGACDLVQPPAHAASLVAHHLGLDLRFIPQRRESLERLPAPGRGARRRTTVPARLRLAATTRPNRKPPT